MEIEYTPKGQAYRGASAAFRVIIFAVVAVSLLLVARIIFLFFGQLKDVAGFSFVTDVTDSILWPFKDLGEIKTPYDGIFDVGATILLLVLVFTDFVLTGIAGYFRRQSRREIINPPKPVPQIQVVISPTIAANVATPVPVENAGMEGDTPETGIAKSEPESVKIPDTP